MLLDIQCCYIKSVGAKGVTSLIIPQLLEFRVGFVVSLLSIHLNYQHFVRMSLPLKRKRHYKKDTSYLYDLYTLTFDENETLESMDETVSTYFLIFNFHFSLLPTYCSSSTY